MSDYNGPSEPCRVQILRPWGLFELGEVYDAIYYPELGTFYVKSKDIGYGGNFVKGDFVDVCHED